jgi:raffinose/stachyose/melibiose transport system permease protein
MKSGTRDWKRGVFIAVCVFPALAFLAVFLYYPIAETFRLSTMRTSGMGDDLFIGLENFRRLAADSEFRAGLAHVFQWAFWSVAVQLPLAFAVAFSLTFYVNKTTGPLRVVYYLANILPSAITAMLGKFVFGPTNGIIASIASAFGLDWLKNVDFLGNPDIVFWTVFTVATWTYTGFPIVYLMARIEQISTDIREAAELDGAVGWRYAFSIVLPALSYPLRILAVLSVVGSLKLFDLPYLMTTGGPGNATVTLGITLYRHGFINWQYGKAAAIGVVIFLLSLAFTVVQFSWRGKEAE